MDERPSFSEIVAWSGAASALGGGFLAALVIVASSTANLAILLALFISMSVAVIFAMFTAFPLEILIGYPIGRFIGWSYLHAAATGLGCSICLLYLWSGGNLRSVTLRPSDEWFAFAFVLAGPLAGAISFYLGFGSFASARRSI